MGYTAAAAAVCALQQTKAVGALSPPSPVLERAGWALSFLEEISPVSWLAASPRPANATASDSSAAFGRERGVQTAKQNSQKWAINTHQVKITNQGSDMPVVRGAVFFALELVEAAATWIGIGFLLACGVGGTGGACYALG